MQIPWRRLLLGNPLPSEAYAHQRLNKVKALAVFSSDALSSVAYATEEILLVLMTAGVAAFTLSMPIALVITGLLAIVAASYYQTVHGYPSGGGAYIVAHENLGVWPGLIAAAALLIDYVLTVAVSITAGVVAVTSAVPGLFPAADRIVPAGHCPDHLGEPAGGARVRHALFHPDLCLPRAVLSPHSCGLCPVIDWQP